MILPDVQSKKEGFKRIPINKVGIRNLKIPILFLRKDGTYFNGIANVSSYCDLSESIKGINMSRIPRTIYSVLDKNNNVLNWKVMDDFITKLKKNHGENTQDIYISFDFDYLIVEKSPVTSLKSYFPVNVELKGIELNKNRRYYLTVKVSGTSVCPCSKEMSLLKNNINKEQKEEISSLSPELKKLLDEAGFGAHNQRSVIEVTVELNKQNNDIMWVEDIVDICNKSFSVPVYSILKRNDEKYVTEVGYMGKIVEEGVIKEENKNNYGPKFVEDIVRDVSYQLDNELKNRILDYIIIVNNQESIHPDNVFATAIKSAGLRLR